MKIHFLREFSHSSQTERVRRLIESVEQKFPTHWQRIMPSITIYVTSDELSECPEYQNEGRENSVTIDASKGRVIGPAEVQSDGVALICSEIYKIYAGGRLFVLTDEEILLNICYKMAEVIFLHYPRVQEQFARTMGSAGIRDLELFGSLVAEAFVTEPAFNNVPQEIRAVTKKHFKGFDQLVRALTASRNN